LLKIASERERQLHEQAREQMLSKQAEMSKYFNQGDEVQDATSAVQYAIYDNGDVRSSNNQLVRQIETS